MTVLQEEKTTLPEGAIISLAKYQKMRPNKTLVTFTELMAYRGKEEVKMKVDDISACNMVIYMKMLLQAIRRSRSRLTSKPIMVHNSPKTIDQFVNNMAFYDMFIFDALSNSEDIDADTVAPIKKMVQRRRKMEKLPQVQSDSNGTVLGSRKAKTNRRRTK